MSNEIIPTEVNLPVSKYQGDDKQWMDVVSSSSFLPYIQLCGGNSAPAKEGKIPIGHYGLMRGKDSLESLTAEFDCLPCGWRFKAMEFGAVIRSIYNPKNKEFLDIMHKADNVKESKCVYGPEFLLWIPSKQLFATMLFGSKTARREVPKLKELHDERRAATLKSNLIKTDKYMWHGPVVVPCSTPFNPPDMEDLLDQATRFANPKETEIEAAEPVAESARPR